MANRLWRIYRSEPTSGVRSIESTPGLLEEVPTTEVREVYLTTVSAPSADAALTKYNRQYGAVMGTGEYAIQDEDATGSRII